ncbi:MAG: 30S ribosomal protein S17 [Anaerolineae bacterium]
MREGRRKLVGRVISDRMDKTVVVEVERARRHKLYQKVIRSRRRFMAHDEENLAKTGNLVRIVESRPLSRRKRWRVEAILEQ